MFFSLALVMFGSLAFGQDLKIRPDNLRTLMKERSHRYESSQQFVRASENRDGYFLRSFLPKLRASAKEEKFKRGEAAWMQQPSYGLEARFNLFRSGKDYLEHQIRDLETEKRISEKERVFSEEVERATSHFWKILFYQEKLRLLEIGVERNAKNLTSALRRISSGVATASDRFEFEINEVNLKREIIQTKEEEEHERKELAMLLNLPMEKFELQAEYQHDHEFEHLKDRFQNANRIVKSYEIQAHQKSLSAKQEQRSYWPEIDAFANWNQFNQREENFANSKDRKESVFGLELKMEFSFERLVEASALANEAEALSLLANREKQELELNLEVEWVELKLLHDQVHEAEQNIERAKKYYQFTQQEYARGAKNSPDVLGASEKLFSLELKRLEVIRDFQTSRAHFEAKVL
jgi:outer membrane protein